MAHSQTSNSISGLSAPTRDGLLGYFRELKNIIAHALTDFTETTTKKIFYNVDYDLIYPWLWPGAPTKSYQYDLVGRNIFSIFTKMNEKVEFKVCFTVPSILEFLDTIEHRYSHYSRLSESRFAATKIFEAFKSYTSRDFAAETAEGAKLKSYISDLHLGAEATNLRRVVTLFERNILSLAHEHVEMYDYLPIKRNSLNNDVKSEYQKTFERMRLIRGQQDDRPLDDKLFHYKVDSWNIAFRLINQIVTDKEFAYVCRPTIRQFFQNPEDQSIHSRHPMVLLYQLYAALAAPANARISVETRDFLEDACARIAMVINRLEKMNAPDLEALSEYSRDRIDEFNDLFVRPLLHDYNQGGKEIEISELPRIREQAALRPYVSITSPDGFRDRFKQSADCLKQAAHALADVAPLIVDERLLEPYDLSNNPRVREILRTLQID